MQAQLVHGQGVIPEYQSKGIKILAQQLRPRVHGLLFSVSHDLQLTRLQGTQHSPLSSFLAHRHRQVNIYFKTQCARGLSVPSVYRAACFLNPQQTINLQMDGERRPGVYTEQNSVLFHQRKGEQNSIMYHTEAPWRTLLSRTCQHREAFRAAVFMEIWADLWSSEAGVWCERRDTDGSSASW